MIYIFSIWTPFCYKHTDTYTHNPIQSMKTRFLRIPSFFIINGNHFILEHKQVIHMYTSSFIHTSILLSRFCTGGSGRSSSSPNMILRCSVRGCCCWCRSWKYRSSKWVSIRGMWTFFVLLNLIEVVVSVVRFVIPGSWVALLSPVLQKRINWIV